MAQKLIDETGNKYGSLKIDIETFINEVWD